MDGQGDMFRFKILVFDSSKLRAPTRSPLGEFALVRSVLEAGTLQRITTYYHNGHSDAPSILGAKQS